MYVCMYVFMMAITKEVIFLECFSGMMIIHDTFNNVGSNIYNIQIISLLLALIFKTASSNNVSNCIVMCMYVVYMCVLMNDD